MITFPEVHALLAAQARSFGVEEVKLEEASGRVLAENVRADRPYPPFNRSAMDGYALKYSDWEQGIRRFRVAETLYAGSVPTRELQSGQCFKIMTGAAVPEGADTVVRREDTSEWGSDKSAYVDLLLDGCRPFQNISRKGEDLKAQAEIIDTAIRLEPSVIGLLATLGKSTVLVERLPRVALFTTGNEVVPVEAPVGPVQIRNSNRWLLQSFLGRWGIAPFICRHLPDDVDSLRSALQSALEADILILSGGVSAGDADYVPQVLEELGVKKLFHKVAIKPGKPLWCGQLPGGGMVFALPGNPFSCLVNANLFIQHYLQCCFGLPGVQPVFLPLYGGRSKKTKLDEFFPVRLSGRPTGLVPVVLNGSGDIRLGLGAQGLALHAAGQEDLPEGEIVPCYML
ncbi:molybdopterin molybdotransferase MoeA [Paraflavisolibacter sp. H34]|uniref:molybdopterin molybdotransferase MoeA n=1 Tax=Huijunlia imazamoxiresistens TaxID=3127457 RepID=UPI003016C850